MFHLHNSVLQKLKEIENNQALIIHRLDQLLRTAGVIYRKEVHMAGELDALQTEVTETGTVIDSAIALIQGLKAKLDEAIASGDMSRVSAITAELDAKSQALAAAVQANTTS